MKTFRKLKSDFLDVLYLFFASHENQSWANAKTHELDKQGKQPISCVGGEISTKNWKFEHDLIRWDSHVGSRRNMFQLNVRCISWDLDENVCLQSGVDELVSWSLMKEKFLKFCENMLWVEKTSESGWEVWVFILRKDFSL